MVVAETFGDLAIPLFLAAWNGLAAPVLGAVGVAEEPLRVAIIQVLMQPLAALPFFVVG